jgi:CheY-like chemotaxis protein
VPKRKLLLADDSPTIQKVINLTFTDEGIDVLTVGDGDSAIAEIERDAPGVVLADIHMPGINGYQICERIRRDPATHDIPVLLLVGSFEPFDEAEAARVGANGYLTKPFQSIRQLVTRVSELMEAHAPEPASVAEFPERIRDTADIENLYSQSVGEKVEVHEEATPPGFVDVGMDDEMIETSYTEGATAPARESIDEGFQPETVERPNVEALFDQFAETAEIPLAAAAGSESRRVPSQRLPEPVADLEYEEGDLLELPPLESRPTEEGTRPPAEPAAEVAATPAEPETETKKPTVEVPTELIEVIVQKVVEKLSEKR